MNSGLANESTEGGFPRAASYLHTITMANGYQKPSQGSHIASLAICKNGQHLLHAPGYSPSLST